MSRELWLLRHGKAKRNLPVSDFDRPLTKHGNQAARHVGERLKHARLIPDLVISSPAKRAVDTATLTLNAIGIDDISCHFDQRLYFEGIEKIMALLAEISPKLARILLVGHNPDLENLLIHLLDDNNLPDHDLIMPTAALARIKMPDDWTQLQANCGQFISLTV